MKTIVIGMGIQGRKRSKHCGDEFMAFVDPNVKSALYPCIHNVPLASYDAACVCTPYADKIPIIQYLLKHKKHVLVEKPLWEDGFREVKKLHYLAAKQGVTLYTAYNHRFEPCITEIKALLDGGKMGEIYHCRIFYGNGTARLVRESPWRDSGVGIFGEIGSHLLDCVEFLFGKTPYMDLISSNSFENSTPDHVVFGCKEPSIELEATYCSWKNTFTCDIYGQNGSIHANGLCKWGPSSLVWRQRVHPAGAPTEKTISWLMPDPTWEKEYEHFKSLCETDELHTDMTKDIKINHVINSLEEQARKQEKWKLE